MAEFTLLQTLAICDFIRTNKKISYSQIEEQISIQMAKEENPDFFIGTGLSKSSLQRKVTDLTEEGIDNFTQREKQILFKAVNKIISDTESALLEATIESFNSKRIAEDSLLKGSPTNERFRILPRISDIVSLPNSGGNDLDLELLRKMYCFASPEIRHWWNTNLNTYLALPDVVKAALLCCSYIGTNISNIEVKKKRISQLLDFFYFNAKNFLEVEPRYQIQLINILEIINEYKTYDDTNVKKWAIDKNNIDFNCFLHQDIEELDRQYISLESLFLEYKSIGNEYTLRDFIHAISFPIFLRKEDWAVALSLSVLYYKKRDIIGRDRKLKYKGGCTDYHFSKMELELLLNIIKILN
ncbi:hypothetical protein [Lachnospira multipara]|uniref:hypothetical protein n=1 Tax=Lachnospira multipara TaxID=28051 RepID=UPI00041E5EDE|nr:hypothetical protein [Lachnospira multipara]